MGMLLAFAPFIVFAVFDSLGGATPGLLAGAATSLLLLLREVISRRIPKVLEIGTFILFAGLAAYSFLGGDSGNLFGVRLRVDAGLLVIVLVSMAIRRPFTMQYARQTVAKEFWNDEAFMRTNYIITAVWAVAFLIMVIADLILVYEPTIPPRVGIITTVLALVGAFKFTSWYPGRVRANATQ